MIPARLTILRCALALAMALPGVQAMAARQISFWTMQLSPTHDDYVHGLIARFEAAHPGVKVKWVDVPWSEMERKTLTAIAARRAPDVVNLNPQFAAKLAEFGVLADPKRYLRADEIAAYLPSGWQANQLGGRQFGVPWYLTTNITLYNREVLAQAGVAPPRTQDELLAAARRIRSSTGGYAYFPALDGSTPLEVMAASSPLTTPDGCRAGFLNARGGAVFDYYRTLYRDGLVPKSVLTEGHREAVALFMSGQVAMISTGIQFLDHIRNANPGLYPKIGVGPQIGSGLSRPNIAAMNLVVPSASREPALAFRFAQFVTNAENQNALVARVPILPSTVASYQSPAFTKSSGDALLDAAKRASVAQVFAGTVLVPPMRHYSKLQTSYLRNLQAYMLGSKSRDAAFSEIDRSWAQALGCK